MALNLKDLKKFPGNKNLNGDFMLLPVDDKNYTVADKKKVIQSYREDKAFDNVVSMLRKKHGEGSVISKDSPKPKAKPLNAKQIWRKDDENAVQREIDARYGGTANRKAGRGLGT